VSGVAVVFRRDGSPVSVAEMRAMTSAMAHRGSDGIHHEVRGPFGVGFCSLATTPKAEQEVQPLCHGPLMVALDGRFDDRANLRAGLGGSPPPSVSDIELLAAAVERWGDAFVDHLLGDFAAVVVDTQRRRLVCVRDHLGVKPLYYATHGQVFVAASEVRAVLAHPDVPEDVNPEAFVAYAEHWVVPESTLYKAINPLPMGSLVRVGVERVEPPVRYWSPTAEPDRDPTASDLVEEYRCLMDEAVRDRLRSSAPVVICMSGGLDSTSVAARALALSHAEPGLSEVRVASAVFPGHRRIDESHQIDAMERALAIPIRRVRPRPRSPADLAAEVDRYRELPNAPNDMSPFIMRTDEGERVMLTGLGGDDWFFAAAGLEVMQAVRDWRLPTAIQAARRERAEGRYASATGALWRSGVRPQISRIVRAGRGKTSPSGVPFAARPMVGWMRNSVLGSRFAALERRTSELGFEVRHPLHDVRLIQLALRLPDRMRTLDGDPRWLPRRAMGGRLPEQVRIRREKAEFSLMVREELELAAAEGTLQEGIDTSAAAHQLRAAWLVIKGTEPDLWDRHLTPLWSALAVHIAKERLP
jgi:asparagine synthase (glutamine-hydrolysing)